MLSYTLVGTNKILFLTFESWHSWQPPKKIQSIIHVDGYFTPTIQVSKSISIVWCCMASNVRHTLSAPLYRTSPGTKCQLCVPRWREGVVHMDSCSPEPTPNIPKQSSNIKRNSTTCDFHKTSVFSVSSSTYKVIHLDRISRLCEDALPSCTVTIPLFKLVFHDSPKIVEVWNESLGKQSVLLQLRLHWLYLLCSASVISLISK